MTTYRYLIAFMGTDDRGIGHTTIELPAPITSDADLAPIAGTLCRLLDARVSVVAFSRFADSEVGDGR